MASAKQKQDIVVRIATNFKGINVCLPKFKKLVKTICNRFTGHQRQDTRYEISIAVVGDAEIRNVNSQFLNRKSTCDCLSFDLSDDEGPQSSKLFELVVNGEMAVEQANLRGHSSEAELALYITHGLLHNLGFDDSTRSGAQKMHDTEDEILQKFGYGPVYNRSKRISNIE
jgi:probable rRNA maturation factor